MDSRKVETEGVSGECKTTPLLKRNLELVIRLAENFQALKFENGNAVILSLSCFCRGLLCFLDIKQ